MTRQDDAPAARQTAPPPRRRARRRDLRLAPVVGVAWTTASVVTLHPSVTVPIAISLWSLALAAVLAGVRCRGGWRTFLAVAAICAAGGAAVATHVAAMLPARAVLTELPTDGGRALQVRATVVGKVERSATGWRTDAVAHEVRIGDERRAVDAPVLLRLADAPEGLDLGALVEVRGTTSPPRAGERAVLVVHASEATVLDPPRGVLASAAALRDGLQAVAAGLPEPGAGLIAGLSVGDTSGVGEGLDAAMKASSLSHLTAVSGANCALVVGIAFAVAAWCGVPRAGRVIAGLAALGGFVVLVSPEPSVVRAGAMAVIAMLGVLLGRIGAGVSILATAIVVLLVIDPWLASSLGFALSAAATGSLLLAAGPLADGLARWMPSPLALAVSVPLAAQLACGPLLVLITPTIPVYGVVANLLAAPAAPAGTVVGLAACLAAGIPVVGSGLAALAWVPAAWIAGTAETFAGLPANALPWLEGWPGLLALSAVGAAIGVLAAGQPAWAHVPARVVAALSIGCLVGLGPIAALVERGHVPAGWSIAACDVGQGDALLVRSGGRTALIDTGPDPEALRRCLALFGIREVDLLVLTHFDLDHRGGLEAVEGRVDVVLHGPPGSGDDHATLRALAAGGAEVVPAATGMSGRLGEARWRVLWPRANGRETGNTASVVTAWEGGGLPAAILLGDLDAEAQRGVRRELRGASFAVVKVAHHGSADQDHGLYAQLHAALALVTVGENTYGHPRAEILDALRAAGTTIARTDADGAVAVSVDDDGALRVWRQRGGDAEPSVGAPR
ncbi:ComEC/Rec2 family competence protein [Microbacterium sp. No. 7]|uniref:ComEC/Rec2 family competence protein n=1 Tax=Microbacterium sp. No. 7 TaxID=1714373 RepID=UPI0006ECE229|nr:ComEC/Rec2 family competence protein [Microbacterium sp. No. 7]ALJ20519.1 competence protein ComEC [Microbacterium sp. No. 7]